MTVREQTILVISDNPSLCAKARRELQREDPRLRVASVTSVDAARRIVADSSPAVIVLEQSVVEQRRDAAVIKVASLDSVVSSLAAYAPVVVLGSEQNGSKLAALVAAGAADYVSNSLEPLRAATKLIRRRLDQAQHIADATPRIDDYSLDATELRQRGGEDFGEILRHELNNPLTGILGNAELLLVELRRKTDDRVPQGGMQRLETIAALAVRMRETIRRLSQEWESRRDLAQIP